MTQNREVVAYLSTGKKRFVTAIFVTVLLTLCLHSAWTHVWLLRNWTMLQAVQNETNFPTLEDYANLEARAPFSFRVMVPILLRTSLNTFGDLKTGRKFPADSTLNITMVVIDWVSCSIAALFTYLIVLRTVHHTPFRWYAFLAPFLLIWTINYNYLTVPNRALFYPYDFPELAFVAAIFWAIMDPRPAVRALLVVLIPLAVLNKETALFFLLVFVAARLSIARLTRNDVTIVILAGILGIVAKLATFVLSGTNLEEFQILTTPAEVNASGTGGLFVLQFLVNLKQFFKPISWVFATNFGLLWVILLLFTQWSRDRLSLVIGITMILWVLIMLMVGVSREFRIFGPMAIPLLWIIGRSLQLASNGKPGFITLQNDR